MWGLNLQSLLKVKVMMFAVKTALLAMAATVIGDMAANTPQITGEWLIDVKTVCAVGGVVLLGAWRISAWLQRLEARLIILEKKFHRVAKHLEIDTDTDN